MNKRIKDLIKAAGGIGHDDDGQELTPMLVGSEIEKFVNLIVRECALQCVHNEDMDLIEKHFGVEE